MYVYQNRNTLESGSALGSIWIRIQETYCKADPDPETR